MTWSNKFVRIALIVGVLGALALAAGADWVDGSFFGWLF
jgi:hypothetical protein